MERALGQVILAMRFRQLQLQLQPNSPDMRRVEVGSQSVAVEEKVGQEILNLLFLTHIVDMD